VRKDTHGGGLVPNAERLDLGGIQPGNWQYTQCEAVEVDEDEGDSSCSHGKVLLEKAARDDGHADGTAGRGEHDGPSSADSINVEVWWPGEDGILSESD